MLVRLIVLLITLCLLSSLSEFVLSAEPPENERQMAAVLVQRCLACHGPAKQEGGYRVDSFERLRKPGDSGANPIVPGNHRTVS